MDEYLISDRGLPWMNMLDELFAKYPDAAGLTFFVKVHIISPNLKSNRSQFKVGQYLNSTRPWSDRVKHVTMPDRLASGGISTHEFTPNVKAGFKSYWVRADDAVIHHFRPCRKDWLKGHCTCSRCEQSLDDTVAKLFKKIEPDVLKLKAKLFD
ncbi:uncharacterized protein LOC127844937 [Dreissena polymorpha]|uniref:Glycosyltransferase family 92 protein n=1 Tax=Dreissena polymorpha TaxID=45954 RepID=A0A9D4ECZ4_DREPO|nr:uncharacterized protein LOC127844937 [Dreissena polymorpha]XP_052231463.1 uncharacterized protein LOC127844937 [Dreissena polymorpha]KAH3776426.1 hypothetical protein DPMN_177851 [Dreissena polymorpha]